MAHQDPLDIELTDTILRDSAVMMLPLLRFCGDGAEHSTTEALEWLADEFKLTAQERSGALLQSC